jgi:hypothetical protein
VPEHPLQRQIADALRLEIAPPGKVSRDGVVWWSVDHASYAGTAPGARVGRGTVAGVRDLFVLHRGIAHMVEIKTPAGELSDPQQSVMSAVLAGGGRVGAVRNADEMLELLDAGGIPRARGGWWCVRVLPRERPQVDRRQRHGRAPTTASENECNLGEQLPRAAACRGAHWPPNARLECVRVGKQMPLNACNKMLTSHGRAASRTQLSPQIE